MTIEKWVVALSCLLANLFTMSLCHSAEALAPGGEGVSMRESRVYVSGYNNAITCFSLELETGELRQISASDGGSNPSYLAFHPGGQFLYAANETGNGHVTAFAIDPGNGALRRINSVSSAGDGPCHLSIHPGGKWIFVANYGSGTVAVLPINADGGAGEAVCKMKPGANAHMIVSDPSGRYVFVPCKGADYIAQYVFDSATGELHANTPPTAAVAKGAGPRHLAFHPNGRFAYLISELGNTINSLRYDSVKGTLALLDVFPALPEGIHARGFSTAHIQMSPSGAFVYGSNRGHDSIVIYKVAADTGGLSLAGFETADHELKIPRDFTLDLSGRYLIAASQGADSVTVFRVDSDHGTLKRLSSVKVPPGPAFVGVMQIPTKR